MLEAAHMSFRWRDFCNYDTAVMALKRDVARGHADSEIEWAVLNNDYDAMKPLLKVVAQACDEREITLHRQIVLVPKHNEHIKWSEVGRFWAYSQHKAFPYYAEWADRPGLKTVHIIARAALNDVDWDSTLFWALRDPELHEIRLLPGTVVDILKVEWREGGGRAAVTKHNPWRRVTDHPETAQVLP